MPWTSKTIMDQRLEFVALSCGGRLAHAELCRRFGISRKTGYKWLQRAGPDVAVLDAANRSRRPLSSPWQLSASIETQILRLRNDYPAWGARKLRALLEPLLEAGQVLPAASTVHQVLVRHGCITAEASKASEPFHRFEHPAPNILWQMDYKGHFPLLNGQRCHPLTVLDDHSRFNLVLHASYNEQTAPTQQALIQAFRRYGLPQRMTMDNGSPWGNDRQHGFTPLTVWLMQLGIRIGHSRPYHPQTQGKDERFHRTLKLEVLRNTSFANTEECQQRFDQWRELYNHTRPHEALNFQTPSNRYEPSNRSFPEHLPPIEYDTHTIIRKVQDHGIIHFKGFEIRTHKALKGRRASRWRTAARRSGR